MVNPVSSVWQGVSINQQPYTWKDDTINRLWKKQIAVSRMIKL